MAQSNVEKIANIEQEIKQLKERQQQHNLQECKDRTKRICKRVGFLKSMLPDTIPLTHEQFKAFLEKTVLTDIASKILAEIVYNPNPLKRYRTGAQHGEYFYSHFQFSSPAPISK